MKSIREKNPLWTFGRSVEAINFDARFMNKDEIKTYKSELKKLRSYLKIGGKPQIKKDFKDMAITFFSAPF